MNCDDFERMYFRGKEGIFEILDCENDAISWLSIQPKESIDLIRKVADKAVEYFGKDIGFDIGIWKSQECLSDIAIVVKVIVKDSVKKTLENLERFDEEWWCNASMTVDTNIIVTTSYV